MKVELVCVTVALNMVRNFYTANLLMVSGVNTAQYKIVTTMILFAGNENRISQYRLMIGARMLLNILVGVLFLGLCIWFLID